MLGLDIVNPDIVPRDAENKGVRFCNSDFIENLEKWAYVDIAIGDKNDLRRQAELVLPKPSTNPDEPNMATRYDMYWDRAVWFGVTKRTLSGLVGEVFATDPTIEGVENTQLATLVDDADGSGVTLEQQARATLTLSIAFGRAGLLTDYPKNTDALSYGDQLRGHLSPVILRIEPQNIINWRTQSIGSKRKLTLVVIRETYEDGDDGFSYKYKPQWRVLNLKPLGLDWKYSVDIWRLDDKGSPFLYETILPTKPNGAFFDEIPFTFVGPYTNDAKINDAPLYDMAVLNVAHFRNSADYEEMVFFAGQVTPVFTGLDAQYITAMQSAKKQNFSDYKIVVGSREAVLMPKDATAQYLQAQQNTLCMEAMLHKESQMRALGAKLVENVSTTKTATQDVRESSQDSSVLASCAVNVSAAMTKALKWAAQFVGMDDSGVEYTLSTNFTTSKMTYNDRMQLMKEWQGGAISFEEYRFLLRRDGIAYLTDDKAKSQIQQAQKEDMNAQVDHAAALNDATGNNDDSGNQ